LQGDGQLFFYKSGYKLTVKELTIDFRSTDLKNIIKQLKIKELWGSQGIITLSFKLVRAALAAAEHLPHFCKAAPKAKQCKNFAKATD
jgi:hypothetical protein